MPDDNAGAIDHRSKSDNAPAAVNQFSEKPAAGRWGRRLRLLAGERNFRIFFAGYSTSLLGTAMSRIALTFAVLESGGTAADLGLVFGRRSGSSRRSRRCWPLARDSLTRRSAD
jgi:hypothetical protein